MLAEKIYISKKVAAQCIVSPDMEQMAKDDPALADAITKQLQRMAKEYAEKECGDTILKIEYSELRFGEDYPEDEDGVPSGPVYMAGITAKVWVPQ